MTLLDVSNPDNKFIMASPQLRGMIANYGLKMIEQGNNINNDVVVMLIQELEKLKNEKNKELTLSIDSK